MPDIIIPHDKIKNSQTCYRETENAFKAHDLDAHKHEVKTIDDDFKKGVRRLEVIATKHFIVPELPWKKDKK